MYLNGVSYLKIKLTVEANVVEAGRMFQFAAVRGGMCETELNSGHIADIIVECILFLGYECW